MDLRLPQLDHHAPRVPAVIIVSLSWPSNMLQDNLRPKSLTVVDLACRFTKTCLHKSCSNSSGHDDVLLLLQLLRRAHRCHCFAVVRSRTLRSLGTSTFRPQLEALFAFAEAPCSHRTCPILPTEQVSLLEPRHWLAAVFLVRLRFHAQENILLLHLLQHVHYPPSTSPPAFWRGLSVVIHAHACQWVFFVFPCPRAPRSTPTLDRRFLPPTPLLVDSPRSRAGPASL